MPKACLHFAFLLAAFLVAAAVSGQSITASPYRKVAPIRLSEVKWTGGFWQQRHATCRDKMVPSMWEIMKGTKYKPFLEHFRIAAGLSEGNYHGEAWNDGDFCKFLEAVCAVQAVERDPEWDRRLDEIITVIGKARDPTATSTRRYSWRLATATPTPNPSRTVSTSRCTTWDIS